MHKFWNLVKRHCLVFLRDKTAVFFSFLAMIIIIVLMGVFLSKMNVDSILSLLEQFRRSKATATDRKNATELVYYCILAGILMTNSLTVSTSVIGIYIDDIKSHAIDCFYSAPIKRSIVSLSYIAASMMVSMMMCLATLGVFLAFIVLDGGEMLSLTSLLKVISTSFCFRSLRTGFRLGSKVQRAGRRLQAFPERWSDFWEESICRWAFFQKALRVF